MRHRAVRAHSCIDSCVSHTVVSVVLRVSRVLFTRVDTRRVLRRRVTITCVARRLRVIINSLPLISTHVNDVNTSCHIF